MRFSPHSSPKPRLLSSLSNSVLKPKWKKNTSTTLFALLQNCSNLHHLNQIHAQIITSGLTQNPFLSSKLIISFLSSSPSNLIHAHSIFRQIQDPNLFSWNSMLRAYSHSSTPQEAVSLYNQMRQRGTFPDHYTFPFVLKACSGTLLFHKGEETHCLTIKLGLEFDVFVQNSLIYMYAVCGAIDISRRVFDFIPILVRDVVSWNSMISGYLRSGRCDDALGVFREMEVGSVRPNAVTLASVFTACARIGDLDLGRKVHCLLEESDWRVDVYLGSSLIDMYAKCGCVESARQVFDEIPERNVVCWTSMIAGYVQSGMFKESIELFREMQISGVMADEATVVCVVSACAHLGAHDQGRWVHAYCDRYTIGSNVTVKNSLIDMYSKCGDVQKAMQIFDGLVERDVFSWTVMISGLALNGDFGGALDLFSQMRSSQVKPNDITFLGVLSACSHGGLVEEGFYYFNCMIETYKLEPRIEHYGCIVDLLGRAKLLVRAQDFIKAMPIKPDAIIWRSLLFACRRNGNIKLAEFSAEKIMGLEPEKCGAHVLLSNTYAAASRWSDVNRVRKVMTNYRIRKQPGCSFIEINNTVHAFLVADKSHPQRELIYETVLEMGKLLCWEGYVPDTSE